MLNLDTHILISALKGDLTKRENQLLSREVWCISDIVLWEMTKLVQLGRLKLSLTDSEVSATLSQIQVLPITIDICQALLSLDFKSDPADEIIAATSIHHRIPLLTRDKVILKSKQVPLA
jgi:PIN domain nuclease of toxin-antitoxin system